MTVIYSFPPGTGGDHVIGMLTNTHTLQGHTVQSLSSVKNLEHLVKIGKASLQDYIQTLRDSIAANVPIIASHHTSFPGIENLTCVRAVWYDTAMTNRFIARDLMTNDFYNDVRPYLNGDIQNIMYDASLSLRHRWLQYIKHIQHHGLWHSHEKVNSNWQTFCIDRLFCIEFVEDVAALANKIGLSVNLDDVKQQHQKWLQLNPVNNYSLKTAIRYLETTVVL